MGVVDKAGVHGVLPDDRVFAVNYPGYPSSLTRATQTLGGEKRIAEARSSDSNYLELKFRPEDPCAHAAFGELQQTSDLLLRIKRKRNFFKSCVSGTTDTAPGSSSPGYEVSADIIARVENTYNFEGMADYQYVLAVHVDAAKRGQKRRNADEHFEKGTLTDMEQEELMMLVPPLFSIKDIPEETVLRPSDFTNKKTKRKNLGDSTSQMEANALPCFALDFKTKDIHTPHLTEVPAPLLWEQELLKNSVEYQLTAATAQLFEERPIWAKATLNDRLTDLGVVLTDNHVRRLLFKTGYYFGYGPFRTLWIKRGYDPRKDPDSRKYQMLDYRIPQAVRETGGGPERQNAKESGPAWRDICCFKVAPQKKFSFLQLYDLQDDFIQELIQKPAEKTTCSEYTGWYRRSTLERIRQHIRVRFLGLMPNEAARELERAEAKSLQRYLSTTGVKKKSSWQDDVKAPEPELNVEETGLLHEDLEIQTPSELSFTPLPKIIAQEDAVLETEKEVEMPDEDEETLEAEAAVNRPIEEEEEEEEEEFEEEEEDEEEGEIEDEEDEEDDIEGQQFKDGGPGGIETGEVPGGFLQQLLQRFPLGSNQTLGFGLGGPAGAEEDDAEYAIYEQADEDDDDD